MHITNCPDTTKMTKIEWGWAFYLSDGTGPIWVAWRKRNKATAFAHFIIYLLDAGHYFWLYEVNEGRYKVKRVGTSAG